MPQEVAPEVAPSPLRCTVIRPAAVQYVMENPARGYPWTIRELAAVLGCSHGTIGHMRTGERKTIPTVLAERFAEAVGVHPRVLFTPEVSTESDTTNAADEVLVG